MPEVSLHEKPDHLFVRVAFEFLPEVSYAELVRLSQLADHAGTRHRYEALNDALIKMQWAKLASMEAVGAEQRIAAQAREDAIPFDPVGQAQHAKALFDFVSHAKASLDSLAVFLNEFFGLGATGGARDFRKAPFTALVCKADRPLGKHLQSLNTWLNKDRDFCDSIIATRDQWQHRECPPVTAMFPIPAVGYLPIPRRLKVGFLRQDTPVSSRYYWSTRHFVEFHFKKLAALLGTVVTRCVNLELSAGSTIPPCDSLTGPPLSLFPMQATTAGQAKSIRVWTGDRAFIDGNTWLEELADKLLRALSTNEADLFAKLAQKRTVIASDPRHQFILVSDEFLRSPMGMCRGDIDLLQQVGLLAAGRITLSKGCTLICGHRGWRVSWPDDAERVVPAVSLTRFGIELAGRVRVNCEDKYIENVIGVLHGSSIDVRLLAITNYDGARYQYDDMDFYEYARA